MNLKRIEFNSKEEAENKGLKSSKNSLFFGMEQESTRVAYKTPNFQAPFFCMLGNVVSNVN